MTKLGFDLLYCVSAGLVDEDRADLRKGGDG
jgi:hypothetical protein